MTTGPEDTSILPIESDPAARQNAVSEPGRQPTGGAGATSYRPDMHGSGPVLTQPAPDYSQPAVFARQKERMGGVKFGSGFFGWVVATALSTFLLAVAAGIAAAATEADVNATQQSVTAGLQRIGVLGGVVGGLILLLTFFAGGYVAGRMARFSGAKQGLAVWLWAVVIGLILAAVGFFVGRELTVPAQLNLPRIDLTTLTFDLASIIALAVVVLVPLIGAVLGGLAGMPYHRRADRAGWTIDERDD